MWAWEVISLSTQSRHINRVHTDILMLVEPTPTMCTGRAYVLTSNDMESVTQALNVSITISDEMLQCT